MSNKSADMLKIELEMSNKNTNMEVWEQPASKVTTSFNEGLQQDRKKVPNMGPMRDPPRVPPGSKKLQNGSQNDSNIIRNLTCRLSENASQRHALSMFLNSSGLFSFVPTHAEEDSLSHLSK